MSRYMRSLNHATHLFWVRRRFEVRGLLRDAWLLTRVILVLMFAAWYLKTLKANTEAMAQVSQLERAFVACLNGESFKSEDGALVGCSKARSVNIKGQLVTGLKSSK